MSIVNTSQGAHVGGAPLTTAVTNEASPGLLLNEIDQRVTRIRPMATPIDQITRLAGARGAGAMTVDYYSVDTKPSQATLTTAITSSTSSTLASGVRTYVIKTSRDEIFEPSETVLVPSVPGYNARGVADSASPLVLYVVSRSTAGLTVVAVNGVVDDSLSPASTRSLPAMPQGTVLVRMGRAAAELDVQTPQYNALPVKASNYCQIFKIQVEESTYQKIANKEVGWTFSDQEEVAVADMRMGMERNFLFGTRCRVYDPVKQEEIMLTGGIWAQAGADYTYSSDTSEADFIAGLTRKAFTGNAGSRRKIMLCGSDLIDFISRFDAQRTLGASDTLTRWGIDFKEITSKYGTLYVVHSETFDLCGKPDAGLVVDPEYITKYSHVPMQAERLDLKQSGVRNTDAVVVTEASCVVLRQPAAHVRVTLDD